LKETHCLGGSFFFKRGHPSRGNARKLFSTIAYQLAHMVPKLNQHIRQIVEEDPSIVHRSLSNQFQELIIKPCRNISLSQPVSIVIDGLDECDGQDIQQEILQAIGSAVHIEHLPFCFLIVSRPESHISETFAEPCLKGLHRPLKIDQAYHDVRQYLLDEFDRIHREHQPMATVPYPWPQREIVESLVQKSSGYFVYVSTVIEFIDDKRFRPVDRLNIILGIKNSISVSPFDPLDQLYHQILCGLPIDLLPRLLEILAVIVSQFGLLASQIDQILELETGDFRLILRGLHSLVNVPKKDSNLSVHHASFLDFLDNPTRCGPFSVRSSQCRTNLAHHLLKTFSYSNEDHFLNSPGEAAWYVDNSKMTELI
jgi:hypothetical protein